MDSSRADRVELDSDERGFYLVVEDDEGEVSWLRVEDDVLAGLDRSLERWREWRAEGEAVRIEYERAKRYDLGEDNPSRVDPEALREAADHRRKADRENGISR